VSIWGEYFTADVPVKPYLGRDSHGDPSYGPETNAKCRVEYRRANVINANGELVTSEIKLYSAQAIDAGSLVTLNGRDWPVISCGESAGLDGVIDHYEMRA